MMIQYIIYREVSISWVDLSQTRACHLGCVFIADLLRNPDSAFRYTPRIIETHLSAELVTPYLRELAQTLQREQALDNFQRMVWRFLKCNRLAMGRFRLIEADEWLFRR